jgi:FkbM family methyltransferase
MKDDISNYKFFSYTRTLDDITLLVNTRDQYISNHLIVKREFEPETRQFFLQNVKRGMHVVDIGANIGCHTTLLSKLVGTDGKVYSFEPCKTHYNVLLFNTILNNCQNCTVYKNGCGDKNQTMYIDKKWLTVQDKVENFGCVSLLSEPSNEEDENIDVISIDSLNLEKVDLVKIDVEGMEDKALQGMKNTILKHTPIVVIEIHTEQLSQITSILKDFNYELTTCLDNLNFIAKPMSKT